jgi:hypothetical protein
MDKIYCANCIHCEWYVGQGDLSRCRAKKKPDERIDDPVVGPRFEVGEFPFCSIANKNLDCELWEEADDATIARRERTRSEDPVVPVILGVAAALILLIFVVMMIGIGAILLGAAP